MDTCCVPCDHIPVRSWPLFKARQLMRDNIEGIFCLRIILMYDSRLRFIKQITVSVIAI